MNCEKCNYRTWKAFLSEHLKTMKTLMEFIIFFNLSLILMILIMSLMLAFNKVISLLKIVAYFLAFIIHFIQQLLPFIIAPFYMPWDSTLCLGQGKEKENETKQLNFLVSHKKFMKRHNKC